MHLLTWNICARELAKMDEDQDNGNVTEDEIMFLLRLRPAPTPPSRRRRQSIEVKPIASHPSSSGWDVIIERKGASSPSPPPLPPKYLPSAPPQELDQSCHWYPKPYYSQTNYNSSATTRVDTDFVNKGYLNLHGADGGTGVNGYYHAPVVAKMVSKSYMKVNILYVGNSAYI